MLHLSRFARLLLVALAIVILPSVYFFYPEDVSTYSRHVDTEGLDQGGVDSHHVRPKAAPFVDGLLEDEEPRAWGQWGAHAHQQTEISSPSQSESTSSDADKSDSGSPTFDVAAEVLTGGVIMPHLGNATAKAELGRAAWRVLHLMTLRFPDNPTADDRKALKDFFHLFSRLYPCGECAEHFQKMLKKYPPQTSSRKAASLWLCHVHNIVNERLHKPEFDCLTLDKTYDCGCGNTMATVTAAGKTGSA